MEADVLRFSEMTDDEVRAALTEHRIGLTPEEARKVQDMLGRPPSITEAVIWGIQGSEHCSYKSSRRFLSSFVTKGTHVILGPKEDSGIVAITDDANGKRWGIVLSHESHNHPSQVVPYEGAATGVGGCVRDVLCMGARVIGSLDSLRLGDLKSDETRAIARDVIRGVAGYGNALGIPNLGGDTIFDEVYNSSCLVNVVAVGLIREDEIIHSYVQKEAGTVGYDIIIVGKATDKSGFGGAAFASVIVDEGDKESNAGAVQEPNPFLERHLLASSYALFDWLVREKKLDKVSFKDLGAGGNVCASVEQVAPMGMGAILNLDAIHTALADLPPQVIACAETQERFCWICHPSLSEHILHHYNVVWDLPSIAEGARASIVGKVTKDPTYTLVHKGKTVCSALSTDITSGLQYVRETKAPTRTFTEPAISCMGAVVTCEKKSFSLEEIFSSLLSHPSHASKSRVFRHYDKNILGNTYIEPGEADASVILPLVDLETFASDEGHPGWEKDLTKEDRDIGVALACGGNGRYGRISPYLQAVNAVVENVRNIAAVGALPRAITDCLNYGNPEVPEQLWALEEGVRGIADAAKGLAVDGEAIPVISGNVSLYNATEEGPIDPTANVCIVGTLPDGRKAVTQQLKSAGSSLYLVGKRKDECGASAYYSVLESMTGVRKNALLGANVPSPDFASALSEIRFVADVVRSKLALSVHDISEGGLLLALFEMTTPQRGIDRKLGISIDISSLDGSLRSDTLLFTETGGFIIEVSPENEEKFLKNAKSKNIFLMKIGSVTPDSLITIRRSGAELFQIKLSRLTQQWENALDASLGSA